MVDFRCESNQDAAQTELMPFTTCLSRVRARSEAKSTDFVVKRSMGDGGGTKESSCCAAGPPRRLAEPPLQIQSTHLQDLPGFIPLV